MANLRFRWTRAPSFPSAEWRETRADKRPRAMARLISSRIWASRTSSSRGRLIEISLCLRFTELNSTVILKPFSAHSPHPYPVIDFIMVVEFHAGRSSRLELHEVCHLNHILVAPTGEVDNEDFICS